MSRPARALWIEILMSNCPFKHFRRSRPARALWIEILILIIDCLHGMSRPARALWIEISRCILAIIAT